MSSRAATIISLNRVVDTVFVALVATVFVAPSLAQAGTPRAGATPTVIALPPSHAPAVTIALQFHAGTVDDPAGQAGVTALAARVMSEGGTQALDAKQLLETQFPMAAEIRARVDKEATTFYVKAHRDHLDRIVPLLTDVVAHPRWDEKQFARLQKEQIDFVAKRLRQGNDEQLGKEALAELLYRDHAYGRLDAGHVTELQKLTLADVKAQAARLFTRDRLTIGLAGGYPPDLAARIQKALASLPDKGAPIVAVTPAAPHGPHVLLVEKDTPSTAISIGAPWTLSRSSPDFAALLVARALFGEHRQFIGRLQLRLREARGLNYGDYAYIESFVQEGGEAATAQTFRPRHQQDFTIWLRPVQNENALFAVRAALYQLERSLTIEPFSDAEVARAKGFLDGYILLWAQTDARQLGYAMDGAALGAPDFLARLRGQIAALTTADVNQAWQRWLRPLWPARNGKATAGLQIVMVGPKAAALKQAILAGTPSPMHYPRDASGKSPDKPAAQVEEDKAIAAFPLGVSGDSDVAITPVAKVFQ
jgi:zinc protease